MKVVLFADYLYIYCNSNDKQELIRYGDSSKLDYLGIDQGQHLFIVRNPSYVFLHWLSCMFEYSVE